MDYCYEEFVEEWQVVEDKPLVYQGMDSSLWTDGLVFTHIRRNGHNEPNLFQGHGSGATARQRLDIYVDVRGIRYCREFLGLLIKRVALRENIEVLKKEINATDEQIRAISALLPF